MIVAAVVIFGFIGLVFITANFWVDWWWYGSVGYRTVLTTRYVSVAGVFVGAAIIAALLYAANWRLALRWSGTPYGRANPFTTRFGQVLLYVLTAIVAISAGLWAAGHWETWRLFFAGSSFGVAEPIYGRDAGFYVFTLPALTLVHQGLIILLLWIIATTIVLYAIGLGLERLDLQNPPRLVRAHLFTLVGIGLLLVAAGYLLANYGLVYSTRGFTFGPGFTDVNVIRPLHIVLAVASLAAAIIVALNGYRYHARGLGIAVVVWLAAVGLGFVLPPIVQQTMVEPSQLSRESPFIANNIALTRAAFDLDRAEMRNLSGAGTPDPALLTPDSPIFGNIRLWDYRIARATFQQLRSFVPYYVFDDVDVDRYDLDGDIQQVLVAPRELDINGLPANVQTWVNRHLAYTHGYGLVVSPINEATSQGLPLFLVGDIPPEGTGTLQLDRPEIYFGEVDSDWVAVNTDQQEVSGLVGDTPSEPYSGAARGSVQLSNYLSRVIVTLYLNDRRVLFSNELTSESRVLLHRTIVDRVRKVAPFLTLDPDPLLVVADGRLVWILDAYSVTDRFPGATPTDEGLNYIRHTAKVVIDAYDGDVTIYRTAVPDPITDAYARIYGNVFTPITDAPQVVRDHFRYPEHLFDIQTQMFANYHVTDPTAFYNGEDRWEIAKEDVEGESRGASGPQPVEGYYMTLPLPGETDADFKIVRSFTPNNRQNLTAWMAAHNDDTGLPRLIAYRFPRQTTIFGPQQVGARINQDPQISSQISLLDRAGSRVIRGNLLVIPVGESILYVQPLYLQATASAGAPTELQFVIVASSEAVEMRPTLAEALAAIAGVEPVGTAPPVGEPTQPGPASALPPDRLAEEALAAYDRGQDALTRGDWETYGQAQQELAAILRQLAGATIPEPIAPGATPTP